MTICCNANSSNYINDYVIKFSMLVLLTINDCCYMLYPARHDSVPFDRVCKCAQILCKFVPLLRSL